MSYIPKQVIQYLVKDHGTVSSGSVDIDLTKNINHKITVTGSVTINNPFNIPNNILSFEAIIIIDCKNNSADVTLGSDYKNYRLNNSSIILYKGYIYSIHLIIHNGNIISINHTSSIPKSWGNFLYHSFHNSGDTALPLDNDGIRGDLKICDNSISWDDPGLDYYVSSGSYLYLKNSTSNPAIIPIPSSYETNNVSLSAFLLLQYDTSDVFCGFALRTPGASTAMTGFALGLEYDYSDNKRYLKAYRYSAGSISATLYSEDITSTYSFDTYYSCTVSVYNDTFQMNLNNGDKIITFVDSNYNTNNKHGIFMKGVYNQKLENFYYKT